MTQSSDIETIARQLAAHFLVAPDWKARLGGAVQTLQRIDAQTFARGAYTPEIIQAMVSRTAEILFNIAVSEPLTVARLYFDLLPRQPGHPLTASVIAALSDGAALVRLLRSHGINLEMAKDEAGSTFITLHGTDQARDMANSFKEAIQKAWVDAAVEPRPQGGLYRVH